MSRISAPSWSAPAWGAIGVTSLFIGITCWWLTQDRSVPIFDAGLHLALAIGVHAELTHGHLLQALTLTIPYPPFAYLVGSLGIAVGGLGVAPLIIAENVFFVTLLALGCYQVGRLAFSPLAGLLAVVFVLGSPLIIAQFHVFMIDAPETSMVAVSVWLVIATEGFSRLKISALAGLAVGLGMLTKEPFAIFVVGVIGITALRGGRRSWRGLALFAIVALAIALPWYIHEFGQIKNIGTEATDSSQAIQKSGALSGIAPPRFSRANLEWYTWILLNAQLLLPLFVFAAVGWVWTLVGFARRRSVSPLALELTVGSFLAWLILTETFVHDTRYSMPLLIYLAVFGAGWIVRLPRPGRIAAATALVLVAIANTLGISFGVGRGLQFSLPGASTAALNAPGHVGVYENGGFLVGAPSQDGDLVGVLQSLRKGGVRGVTWDPAEAEGPDFSQGGVLALAEATGLEVPSVRSEAEVPVGDAILIHPNAALEGAPPCLRLSDGTGVWVRIFSGGPTVRYYCPRPRSHFYGP